MKMVNVQPPGDGDFPRPWCLSGLDDVKLAVDHVAAVVARECPGVPICGLGLSTGSGQLRGYVNATGEECKFAVSCHVDASTTWGPAVESCDERIPLLSQILNVAASDSFKACGHDPADKGVGEASTDVLRGGMLEFIKDVMAPAHGYEQSVFGAREYMAACKPAAAWKCAVPTLEYVTPQDTIMSPEMAYRVAGMYKQSPHVVTVLTQQGTHVIRWEGWWPTCWVTRTSWEFINSALAQKAAVASQAAGAKPTCEPTCEEVGHLGDRGSCRRFSAPEL